jgi:hypothetical protein
MQGTALKRERYPRSITEGSLWDSCQRQIGDPPPMSRTKITRCDHRHLSIQQLARLAERRFDLRRHGEESEEMGYLSGQMDGGMGDGS